MNWLFRFVVGLQAFISWCLAPLFRCRARRMRKPIPKITNKILKYSATSLAKKIRQKEITCVEVVNAYINRIKAVNPIINAVVEDRFSDALKEAEEVNKLIANSELNSNYIEETYPLLGVPLTVKESCQVKGLSYCVGTLCRKGVKADSNGDAVRRLRNAGAIPLLVSNTPEICCGWESTNFITGRTLNPYHTGCTSGGSSGGEGALLGAGASVIGVGSDIAGSIRLPAMFNGVYGHKPTPKLISLNEHYPICPDKQCPDFLVIGPMTRYAEDLRLMIKIMSEDPALLNLQEKVDINGIKVFSMHNAEKSIVLTKVDKEIKAMMDKCVDYLKSNYGCLIDDYKFDMNSTCEMSGTLFYKMKDIPNVLKISSNGKDTKNLYMEIIKSFLGCSQYSLHALFFYFLEKHNAFVCKSKYGHYREKANLLKNDFIEKLGCNGVFLYPTFPISAFEHDKMLLLTSATMYTMVFNILGLPSTNIPLGLNKKGLPIGIQVVAAPYQDRLCFAVAEELEKFIGGWVEP